MRQWGRGRLDMELKPLGFCPSPSGMMMVVDPALLAAEMRPASYSRMLAAIRSALDDGESEIQIGRRGQTAIVMCGSNPDRLVFVKERTQTGALVLDHNLPRDAE